MLSIDKCELAENHLRILYGQSEPSDGLITIYAKKPHVVEFFSTREIRSAALFRGWYGTRLWMVARL